MITDAQFWSIVMLAFAMLFLTALGIEFESGLFLIFAGLSGLILMLVVFEIIGSVLVSGILIAMSILILLRGAMEMLPEGMPTPGG